MNHRYSFCGFALASDKHITELDETCSVTSDADHLINIRLGETGRQLPEPSGWLMRQHMPNGAPWIAQARISGGYLLRFLELADFLVDRAGRQINCVSRGPATSDLAIRAILLDHVLPLVIALRGRYVLHAAAVRTRAGVCVFAGNSGAGKSTIAAQLTAEGGHFLTDDCLVIDEQGGAMVAWPSHPSIKLRDDAMQFLALGCENEPVAEYTTKRRVPSSSFGAEFPLGPLPLARLYFLTRAEDDVVATAKPLIQRLPSSVAFMKLVNHSIRLECGDRALLEREFQFTSRIVDSVPAALLSLPNDLSKLRLAHDAIVADAA